MQEATELAKVSRRDIGTGGADHKFNDDLLLDEADRRVAQELYPDIAYAIYHEDLCKKFQQLDAHANLAKKSSRRWGCVAVTLVSVALLLAVSEPLYAAGRPLTLILAFVSGVFGIVGALIGTFGVLHWRQKTSWLQNRLRTERMRLFHFGTMIRLSHLLLAGKQEEYLSERRKAFAKLTADVLDKAPDILEQYAQEESDSKLTLELPAMSGAVLSEAIVDQWRDYYKRLRIEHQIRYARYKLRRGVWLFSSSPVPQLKVLGTIAAVCVAGLVITHLGVAEEVIRHTASNTESEGVESPLTWMHVVGLWCAIVALALRTLQEGLDPGREVERYRHYRAALQALEKRFDSASDAREMLEAAVSVEHSSANEMLMFLRSGYEARFVM